jgi:hypothetical protein
VYGIHLAQDRDQWRAHVNLWVLQKGENFVGSWATSSFSKTVPFSVSINTVKLGYNVIKGT